MIDIPRVCVTKSQCKHRFFVTLYLYIGLSWICVCVWWEGVTDQVNPWEWKFPSQSLLIAVFHVSFELMAVKKFPVSFKWKPQSQFVDVTKLAGRQFKRSWMKSPIISVWTDILGRSCGKLELLELFRAPWSFICQLEGRRLFWPNFHTKRCKRILAELTTPQKIRLIQILRALDNGLCYFRVPF